MAIEFKITDTKQVGFSAAKKAVDFSSVASAGRGGVDDHTKLKNRAADDQHPINAIAGLQTALDAKAGVADIPSLEGYATESWVEDRGYLTEHQSLSGYATEDYVNGHHDDAKMSTADPVGTGSFSMNRKAGTSVGFNSCTEGLECIASGHVSHAEGERTVANADWTHAEGYCTVADAFISHAEGDHTRASGDASHVEGEWTVAQSPFQHVQGKYNAVDSAGAFADIVGWGSDEDHRKNISSLTTSGDLHLAGNVYVAADNGGTGGSILATVDCVNSHHDDTKQDSIGDLSTIRAGAAKGATALQSVPAGYATETYVNGHHDATKQNTLTPGDNITIDEDGVISAAGGADPAALWVIESTPWGVSGDTAKFDNVKAPDSKVGDYIFCQGILYIITAHTPGTAISVRSIGNTVTGATGAAYIAAGNAGWGISGDTRSFDRSQLSPNTPAVGSIVYSATAGMYFTVTQVSEATIKVTRIFKDFAPVTDDHINSLIDAKLNALDGNGVSY